MKAILLKISLFFAVFFVGNSATAQVYTTGDYKSKMGTLGWAASGTWELYNGTDWVNTSSVPGSTTTGTVYIQSGSTIRINATTSVKNLVIQNGGSLQNENATIRILRINEGSITVEEGGTFGSASSPITLESSATAAFMDVNGDGDYHVNHFRPLETTGVLTVNINSRLNVYGTFSATYNTTSTQQGSNDITVNINSGASVVLSSSAARFISSSSSNTSSSYGKYTYNISGSIDLTAMGSSRLALVPHSTLSSSSLAVNIKNSGVLKLGSGGLRTVNAVPGTSEGTATVTVESGGLIDATATTGGLIVADVNTVRPLVLLGTGAISGTVAAGEEMTFPVAASAAAYSPVIINNSGSSRIFSVSGLQNNLDNSPSNPHVNKQWTITPATAPDGSVSIGLGWAAADQQPGFDPLGTVSLISYEGSSWIPSASTVTGSGTLLDPYIATAAVSSYGTFGIMNGTDVLPLNLVSFNVKLSTGLSPSAQLNWTTENEKNTDKFVIESSTDGILFKAIGSIPAKNVNGTHKYTYTDISIASESGTIYYRLKQVDRDGKYSYSPVQYINNSDQINLLAYPNPATSQLIINHPSAGLQSSIKVFSQEGRNVLNFIVERGSVQSIIDVSDLFTGFYIVVFMDGSDKKTISFIKE